MLIFSIKSMPKYHIAIRSHAMTMVGKIGITQTAKRMCISRSTLWRWKKNGIQCKQRMFDSKLFEQIKHIFYVFVVSTKSVNARIIRAMLRDVHNISLSLKTVYKYIVKLKLSRKRVRTRGTSKKDMTELIAQYKRLYLEVCAQGKVMVSIDECGFSEKIRAVYGYSPIGEPCIVRNRGSWKNHSLLMAVFSTGEKKYFVFDGAVCKAAFEAFIDSLRLDEDHVILADNASIHKGLRLLKNKATILYTPPYEPDSNPIELCFSQVKRVFRELNVGLDEDVLSLVGESVETAITPKLVKSCFRHVLEKYVQITAQIAPQL